MWSEKLHHSAQEQLFKLNSNHDGITQLLLHLIRNVHSKKKIIHNKIILIGSVS